jgi:hypothetical protein
MDKAKIQLMSDTFEIKGVWYLPFQDMESDGVQGILRYDTKKITLELIGTLEDSENEVISVWRKAPPKQVIYGFSNYGEYFTLYDCVTAGAQINAPGFSTVSYIVNRFYAGTQLIADENDAVIEDCTCSFTYLNAWLDINITESRSHNRGEKIEWLIDLNKAFPQKKKINVQSKNILIDEEIAYNIVYPKDYFSDETTKIVLSRFYRLTLIDKSNLTCISCMDNLHEIRKLLTILIGNALHFLYIDINLPCTKVRGFDGTEHEKKNMCRVFFTQVGDINKQVGISPYIPGSMLIRREDVKDIEAVFENWFLQQDSLSEIINPYISDLYLPAYQETKYLNTVRSIETYHRFYIENAATQPVVELITSLKNERELIVSYINENISEENKEYFLQRIYYEDEKNLRKRFKEVFDATPQNLIQQLFGQLSSKEKSKLISKIVDTRNYYTHRDSIRKYNYAINDHIALYQLIQRLTILLQFHVLKHIGIDLDIVAKRLTEFSKNYSAFNKNND